MSRTRTTISRPVTFSGHGLHTGEKSCVTLSPPSDAHGIRFCFGEKIFDIREARSIISQRNTEMVFPDGSKLSTVEHLLSVIGGVGLDDVMIECDAHELPILDGSALPFAEGILEAGLVECGARENFLHITSPICIDDGVATISAIPADKTRITYIIDYPGTGIGTEMKEAFLTPDVFMSQIAPARTFALLSEIEALRGVGLAAGGSLDNALVIGADGPVGGAAYRIENECAAHKALDLIGDLILLGELPVAHYICIKGGHRLHHKLTDRIRGLQGGNFCG